jgi:hypothetical protein
MLWIEDTPITIEIHNTSSQLEIATLKLGDCLGGRFKCLIIRKEYPFDL